jgi:hypothetical protein
MRRHGFIRARVVPALVGANALGCAYSVVPALVDSRGSVNAASM